MTGPVVVSDCPECGGNPCPMPCQTCDGRGRVERPELRPGEEVRGIAGLPPEGQAAMLAIARLAYARALADTYPGVVPPLDPEPVAAPTICAGCHKAIDVRAAAQLAFFLNDTYHAGCWKGPTR